MYQILKTQEVFRSEIDFLKKEKNFETVHKYFGITW